MAKNTEGTNQIQVYLDGSTTPMLDFISVTPPEITTMKFEVTGSAVNTTLSVPIVGSFEELEMSMVFGSDVTSGFLSLQDTNEHTIAINEVLQIRDTDGNRIPIQNRKVFTVQMSSITPNETKRATRREPEITLKVFRYEQIVDGEQKFLLDTRDDIFVVNGEDKLQEYKALA